ncbi:MAG: c-type cytochrome [Anaerolineales bacterium]|nr:c-type cytochrome [Anaerolineales bacterium]
MKFRSAIIVILTILLSACNFTLAEDVTPPPGYIPPTPMPTLGPLFPAQAPGTQNGSLIYAEKCAACHGATGMGDGEQGIQLGVTVPAFGLPDVARPASPAQWYTTVTRGNMERFMPPFMSLNDQERWDVVAYAMTLHMSEQELAKGKELFEANCANCPTNFFTDQSQMSELSEVELARIVKEGNDQVPPFGAALSNDDIWTVAAYLRTLSFDTAPIVSAPAATATPEPFDPAQDEPVTVTATLPPTEAGTPSAEETSIGTEQAAATSEATAVAQAGFGNVSGSVENKTGGELPSDLKVTLYGFDHGAAPSTGPQEVFSQEGSVRADGTFVFENVELPLNRIFIAEVTVDGAQVQSGFAIAKEDNTSLSLPPIKLYKKTDDTSKLVLDEVRIFFEYGTDGVQVFNVYSFRNPSEASIVVTSSAKNELPFARSPEGSSGFGYEPMQDGERLIPTQNGFEVPPSEDSYGLITFASVPRAKNFDFSQQFVLPAPRVTVFVPEGVTIKGAQAKDLGVQAIQSFNFHIYQLDAVGAGEKVELTVSGTPRDATGAAPAQAASNQNLLIAAGALGVALILAGAWMYLRDRGRAEDEGEDKEDEFESAEEVMDAILALDDLHRDRKISDAAYQKRRTELKEVLKGKM